MMKTRWLYIFFLLLLTVALLIGCTENNSAKPEPGDTEGTVTSIATEATTVPATLPDSETLKGTEPVSDSTTEPETVLGTLPATGSITESLTEPASEPETSPATQPETVPETVVETRPPKDIVTFPHAALPNIGEILSGIDNSIRLDFDLTGSGKAADINVDSRLNVVSDSSDFVDSDAGLVSDHSKWRSIGLTQLIPPKAYVAEAELTVADNPGAAYTHTGMVGIHCKTSGHLFIDSGVWFCFINDEVTVSIWGQLTYTVKALPFKASDGIHVRIEEADGTAMVYANDLLIFRVVFSADAVTVYDAEDTEVGSCGIEKVRVGGEDCGFFRVMSHFANSTFKSMKLTVEDVSEYAPNKDVYALRPGLPFGFRELGAYTADGGIEMREGILFADSSIVAGMFDFIHIRERDTHTLTRPGATVVLCADTDAISINGVTCDFTTTYWKDGSVMVDVKAFASMLGYGSAYDEARDTHYILTDPENLTEGKKNMFDERYELYRDVVYNYDDVECDNTGVGKFEAVAPEDRLVGMAYSTWHTTNLTWGKSTWGTPLHGDYTSDDRDTIYRHGVLLAEAGVDFVYVDWSNNTNYDPATMSHMIDFRTIETSTDLLFEIWSKIPGAPKICFLVGPGHSGISSVQNGNHQKKVDQIWRDYIEKYPDMYFQYEGKPLLICYAATPTQYGARPTNAWSDARFTVRWMTGYVAQQNLHNPATMSSRMYWSWEERGIQTYTTLNGRVETVTVSPATRSQGREGDANYIPAAGRQNGATFKRQFQRAMNLGAGMVLLISWNEWHIGEQPSPEISRDLEPSVEHGTFYYDLMREQIRKYKGLIQTDGE